MGLLRNSLRRSREPRLPLFRRAAAQAKERYSDDEYYTTDGDSDSSISGPSSRGSRNASDSAPHRSLLQRRAKKPAASSRVAGLYPYRLPSRTFRVIFALVVGLIVLMIVGLVRASQIENWMVANGKTSSRPASPPLWGKFPFLERYYGGIRTLVPFMENKPEYPQPPGETHDTQTVGEEGKDSPSSKPWMAWSGRSKEADVEECFLDAARTLRPPALRYYDGRPTGFPQHVVGSYEVLGLAEDVCFERFGRFGPYGFGYSTRTGGLGTGENSENEGADAVWGSSGRVDYRGVDWAQVQRRCFNANAALYKDLPARTPTPQGFYVGDSEPTTGPIRRDGQNGTQAAQRSRTAVVVRCWDEFEWLEDDVANLRAMIAELSLASGGRYDVHLLVQVKNDARYPVWADREIYEQRIRDAVPQEFRGLVTLWTETQMLSLYQGIYDLFSRGPELPVHGVYRGLTMAMQHFAYLHPEYDYFWQWEMDVRYTGHYHDLLAKVEGWARDQPRKGLWERNARFYIPAAHGSWEDFSQMARVQSEMGTVSPDNLWKGVGQHAAETKPPAKKATTVWGPVRALSEADWLEPEKDDFPPTSYEADRFSWGAGEEADLITFNPIFDPEGTTWLLRDDVTGFDRSLPLPPRRASIITTSRMSRRLLLTMHKMTAHKKQFAFPEMWPATAALQHGYKAVYAPHPVYVDRRWPVEYMAGVFNGGRDGSSGGSRTSPFGEREHNFKGLSWFYNAQFGGGLYTRWLGMRVGEEGGEEFEKQREQGRGGEGRMCLPPMLLHPVKRVRMPVEEPP